MIGTKLYCHSSMDLITSGKYYTIISVNENKFCIIDDKKEELYFYISQLNFWFYKQKELRKQKLQKLKLQ